MTKLLDGNGSRLTAVGLFSGCGGLDLGAQLAGFDVIAGFDSDPIAIETYKRNVTPHGIVHDLSRGLPEGLPCEVDLLLGGPPCQGFSSAGKKQSDDPRNLLWQSYLDAICALRPKAFLLENVYGFQKEIQGFANALATATNLGYKLTARKFNTQFYGVPQHRLRLIIVGVRVDLGVDVHWPPPVVPEYWGYTKVAPGLPTMRLALEHLGPAVEATAPRQREWGCKHEFLPLEPSHLTVARHVPNGGSIRSIPDVHMPPPFVGRVRPKVGGWPWYYRKPKPSLPARTVTASTRPIYSEVLAPDVYIERTGERWAWRDVDVDAHTTRDGLYCSPVPQRRLSVRESALLQTFPESFEFFGTIFEKKRQIGNAVPVEFARSMCASIRDSLRRELPFRKGDLAGTTWSVSLD